MAADPYIAIFEAERRQLATLAYRMTGSVADSEDILQQAWLRLSGQDLAVIENMSGWLRTVVMRLCLDQLKSARAQRETYVGTWLPEPLVQGRDPNPEEQWIAAEEVNIALILTLQTLSAEMRAAFILRDAFDHTFDEISVVVGRSPATCRQLVSRARRKLAGADPPSRPPTEEALPLVTAFWRASRSGDMQGLLDLFAEEIEVHADGGGKVLAVMNVLRGKRRVVGFFVGLARKSRGMPPKCPDIRAINGSPGFLTVESGGVLQTTAIDIAEGKIRAIWIVRNPEKLGHLRPLQQAGDLG